jgi:hypothetical protein
MQRKHRDGWIIAMLITLKEVLDALPPKRRAEINRRLEDLLSEVDSLKNLASSKRLSKFPTR